MDLDERVAADWWPRSMPFGWRVGAVVALALAAAGVLVAMPPIVQQAGYYAFPDERTILGIPAFWNVVSNLPFAVVGGAGLWSLRGRGSAPRWPLAILFLGVFLVAFGSAWYHLAPGPHRLIWDRLPMTVVFMATFAVVLGDRIDARLERLLPVMVLIGAGTALYWYLGGDQPGGGDLRPYVFVQGFPMLAIPVVLLLFPGRRLDGTQMFYAVGVYGVAKILERYDDAIYAALGGFISGHALKHLVAAVACWFVVAMTRPRATP
jgi:hypothetical protein